MTRGTIARLTTSVGSGAAALEIIAGLKGFWLREIEINLSAATASVYQVGRPAAKGITPTTPLGFLNEQSTEAAPASNLTATTALAWGTPPTVPANFYQTNSLPAAIGASAWMTFYQLYIPAGQTIVLWNGAANSAAYVNLVIEE